MERINYTIYARYSSDLQNPRSADDQVAAILDDVNRRNPGWVHCPQYPAFKDEAVSGTAIAGRSAFKQMVRVAESPDCPFNTVIVEDISRFARNRKDSFDNRNELFIHGVTLLSMADGYADETTEAGLWLTGIKEIKAEADSRETGRRVRRGQIAQVKRDFWPGGAIPFGYRRKPVFSKTEKDIDGNSKRIGVTLKIRQAEAKIVRRVFHLYADRGMGSTRICSQLNRQGYRNRNGQMFNSSFIGAVLRNTIYVGTLTYNKTREVKHPNGKRRKKPNPPEEWIIRENAVPAIIDRATWDKANKGEAANWQELPRRIQRRRITTA